MGWEVVGGFNGKVREITCMVFRISEVGEIWLGTYMKGSMEI